MEAHFGAFVKEVYARLEMGEHQYGDASFERPIEQLIREIQDELKDVAGWGFILYTRLIDLEEKLRKARAA